MAHPWPLQEPLSTFPSRTRYMYLYTRIISSCLRFRSTNRKTDNERSKIPTTRPVHARKQSSITLYYTTDRGGTENRRDADDHHDDCTLYIPEFYYQIPDKIAFTRKYCTGRNAFWLCSHKRHRISAHHRESVVLWYF